MKKEMVLFVFMVFLLTSLPQLMAQGNAMDFPLLSQGDITPPPPPPGYAVQLLPIEPFTAPPPPPGYSANPPPLAPFTAPPPPPPPPTSVSAESAFQPENMPETSLFNQPSTTEAIKNAGTIQEISPDLAGHIARLLSSLRTCRTVVDEPASGVQLRRLLNTGKIGAELLGFRRFPAPSKFVAQAGDNVLRDRSHQAVEYRFFGNFDNRLNGWIKPIGTAVYLDLVFDGKKRRRTHFRAQITRTGPITGYFYAYSWDVNGNPWKFQGTLENVYLRDNGLPSGGELKLYGADPVGSLMALALNFPVKVHGEPEPEQKEIRHRQGNRVSIGN